MTAGTGPPRLRLDHLATATTRPLDLTVRSGTTVALTGHGSAQVLRAIAGQERPTGGSVLVDGTPVEGLDSALDLGVVLVPQGNGLAALLTAYENVVLPLTRHHLATAAEAAHEALVAVGLEASADHLPDELSGGQQQRVAVARAIALRPRVLLADQVTTDLDPGNRARVLALLQARAREGAVVVLASDDPTVTRTCDHLVELRPTEHQPTRPQPDPPDPSPADPSPAT